MNKGKAVLLVDKYLLSRLLLSLFVICSLLATCLPIAEAASNLAKGMDSKPKTVLSPVYYTYTTVDHHSEIVIQSDTALERYRSFSLENPPRLVIDVQSKKLSLPVMSKVVDRPELYRIRAAQRGDAVRFVFDLPLKKKVDFQVAREKQWLKVIINLVDEPAAELVSPPVAENTVGVKGSKSPFVSAAIIHSPAAKAKKYVGKKVSLDLFQEDLGKFFAEITSQTGIFFSLGPEVRGNVSLRIVDVPWDQAVDMVLDYYHLQMERAIDRPSHFVVSRKR